MASTTTARKHKTDSGPRLPMMGTLPSAANQLFPAGTLVTRNGSAQAVSPSTADVSGFPALGVCNYTIDNRTGSELGGAAAAADIDIQHGIFCFALSGAAPLPGQMTYVVDNQTVSADSLGGTRGPAGFFVRLHHDGQAQIVVGPETVAAASAKAGREVIPLNAFRIASSGAAIAAFAAGTTDGFEATAESGGIRWNDDSTVAFGAVWPLPADLDDGFQIDVQLTGYRVGAVDTDAVVTIGAFITALGDAFSADADAGGATSAFDGATTVLDTVKRTIAAADVPAGAKQIYLTMVPSASLDTDDLVVTSVELLYTRK